MTTPTILYRPPGSAAPMATLTACATAPTAPALAASSTMQDMLTTAFPADKTAWGLGARVNSFDNAKSTAKVKAKADNCKAGEPFCALE